MISIFDPKGFVRAVLPFLLLAFLAAPSYSQTADRNHVDTIFQSMGHWLKAKFFLGNEADPLPTVILLHGFPAGPGDVLGLGAKLAKAGTNVLTFNYSGTHQSEGEHNMENVLIDIHAAYVFLRQPEVVRRYHVDTNRIVLAGWCFGGGMALTYASQKPEIRWVISIAGTDHGEFARQYSRNPQMAHAMDSAWDKLRAPGGPIKFDGSLGFKRLVANPDPYDLRLSAKALASHDILLIGGWEDDLVTIDHFLLPLYRALRAAGANKTRFVVYHTDHYFRNVREELAVELIRWIEPIVSGSGRHIQH
jgi:pimeloyl-ACP methyl ester carboxylesterase